VRGVADGGDDYITTFELVGKLVARVEKKKKRLRAGRPGESRETYVARRGGRWNSI